jgi:HEAT repeat protein
MSFFDSVFSNIPKMEADRNFKGLVRAYKNEKKQDEVIAAMLRIGEPAISALITMFADRHLRNTAFTMATVMGRESQGSYVSRKLIEALRNPIDWIRAMSAWTLGNFGCVDAIDALILTMNDPFLQARAFAVESLGWIDDPRTVAPLIEAVSREKEDRTFRLFAVNGLGQKKDMRAVEPLVKVLMREKDADIRRSAQIGLDNLDISKQQITEIQKKLEGQANQAVEVSKAALSPTESAEQSETEKMLSEASALAQSGKTQQAMILILKVLEKEPTNSRALDLAATVLMSGGASISQTITKDPLLDDLFAQCAKCGTSWVVNPIYKHTARLLVTNPAGGICPTCGKIFCRNCAAGSGTGLACPNDHRNLNPISEPNGRKREIAPRSNPKKLALAAILRHAPDVPRPAGYIQLILESSCSEALTDKAVISYQLQDKAPEQMGILAFLSIKGKINGWPDYLDTEKYDILYNTLTDGDGGRCTLVKVYYK